ncbi:MAG: RsmB/NOP family class I SAM-dependent RNA methyltransferase, partial [Burkholderiaceae bacterium]|nr:RsmB/NOP family class I SAM-dependent RNA methyltransferase [Burkholderiaceae bacterium]
MSRPRPRRSPRSDETFYTGSTSRITSLVVDSLAAALAVILKFDGPSDVLLSRYFRLNPSLGQRDRGLIAEAVFSALRRYGTLSWLMRPAHPARAARLAALVTLAR